MKANLLGMLAMASILSSTGNPLSNDEIIENPERKRKPIIPNGCKEYWFLLNGTPLTEKPREDGNYKVIFYCVAISEKSAIKKFKKAKLCPTH